METVQIYYTPADEPGYEDQFPYVVMRGDELLAWCDSYASAWFIASGFPSASMEVISESPWKD